LEWYSVLKKPKEIPWRILKKWVICSNKHGQLRSIFFGR